MCTIEITSVTGTGVGTPAAITVSGTATDCNAVRVRINCSGGVAAQTVSVAAGAWAAVFDAGSGLPDECTCQGHIRVTADGIDTATGGACQDSFSGLVDCATGECPSSVTVTASIDPDSDTQGERTVTLIAVASTVANPPAAHGSTTAAS